jgi:peptidoglycan hydrolase-like protein with peptidoglycan-binding domain
VKSKRLQRRLGELGYYHRLVGRSHGPRTRAAIAAYESTHNLVVDGTITPRLLARMGLA